MAKYTPSMTRNFITRSLRAVIDPLPSRKDVDALWQHFENACAYCAKPLERASRTGHLDHSISGREGGNSVYNHVLACSICNGDLKREQRWDEFLAALVADPSVRRVREAKIRDWFSSGNAVSHSRIEDPRVQEAINSALSAFDKSVKELRELRAGGA